MRPCTVAAEAGVQSVLTGSTKPHPRFRQRAKRRRRGPFSASSPAQRKSTICTNYPWLSLAIFGAFVTPTQVGRQHLTSQRRRKIAEGQGVSLAEPAVQVFTFGEPGCMFDFERAGPTTQRKKI